MPILFQSIDAYQHFWLQNEDSFLIFVLLLLKDYFVITTNDNNVIDTNNGYKWILKLDGRRKVVKVHLFIPKY